jgi:hypothetical protein
LRFKARLDKKFSKPYLKKTHHGKKKRAAGVAQGIGPEFNPQITKKKKKKVSLRTW